MKLISIIQKHLYCFFLARKVERDFRKSVAVVVIGAVLSVDGMNESLSILFNLQITLHHLILLTFAFTFMDWFFRTCLLYTIAILFFGYYVEFRTLMLLSAYSFLTTILGNPYVRRLFWVSGKN
ncbi:hypothetical protein DRP05_08420 [Archaeoglobales archaeon]|nr:MAG: hypothetical protein DRP05_08420 [Archaeoglobales archaeon]